MMAYLQAVQYKQWYYDFRHLPTTAMDVGLVSDMKYYLDDRLRMISLPQRLLGIGLTVDSGCTVRATCKRSFNDHF